LGAPGFFRVLPDLPNGVGGIALFCTVSCKSPDLTLHIALFYELPTVRCLAMVRSPESRSSTMLGAFAVPRIRKSQQSALYVKLRWPGLHGSNLHGLPMGAFSESATIPLKRWSTLRGFARVSGKS